ncbi:hypothetical protein ACHAWF_013668 [Thalassiosira exigua]
MMSSPTTNIPTNQLAGDAADPKKVDDMEKPVGSGGVAAQARRRQPSARRARAAGNVLSNSLRSDRRAGIAATQGRLSVSFSDQKGLSAADIGDILSGFEDGDDEPERSVEDLLRSGGDKEDINNKSISSMNLRMNLMTIKSQRVVNFDVDPKDLEDSDDEK